MKILHYSLGLPPYRSGGLTKYSCDLMEEQVRQGDNVFLLFPGVITGRNKNSNIKFYKEYKGIQVYELINPLPVPLLNGITTPKEFYRGTDKKIFKYFLEKNKIDIFHIHTFMGLYKELLDACKELNIKIVYTTHDYFGICTKVNFIDNKGKLCDNRKLERCIECNSCGYSLRSIQILQSALYRYIKNKGIILGIKKVLGNLKENRGNSIVAKNKTHQGKIIDENEYKELIKYYENMFKSIDKFIFNSTIARDIYNKYLNVNGIIIPITHKDIKDNRVKKYYNGENLRLTYLGPFKEYKGFNLLIDVMKELDKQGEKNIKLIAYGDTAKIENPMNNVTIKGRYSYDDLKDIFKETDLLVVPSIWNETFGFITLEAVSYGVPVLITDKVGSKDLIVSGNYRNLGIVTSTLKDDIIKNIKELKNNKNIINELNTNILNNSFEFDLAYHCMKIKELYNSLT